MPFLFIDDEWHANIKLSTFYALIKNEGNVNKQRIDGRSMILESVKNIKYNKAMLGKFKLFCALFEVSGLGFADIMIFIDKKKEQDEHFRRKNHKRRNYKRR